jgi:hypothetical protein
MRLRDLEWWPPSLSDSYHSGQTVTPPEPAKLKGAKVYSAVGKDPAYLAIIVHYRGRDWRVAVSNQAVLMLKRIEASLRGHEGEPLANLGDVEVVESA